MAGGQVQVLRRCALFSGVRPRTGGGVKHVAVLAGARVSLAQNPAADPVGVSSRQPGARSAPRCLLASVFAFVTAPLFGYGSTGPIGRAWGLVTRAVVGGGVAMCLLAAGAVAQASDDDSDDDGDSEGLPLPRIVITIEAEASTGPETSSRSAAGAGRAGVEIPDPNAIDTAAVFGVEGLVWVQSFTDEDYRRAFPRRAARRGQAGMADLRCVVVEAGALRCVVDNEQPAGWRFGDASLELAERMRAAEFLDDGTPSLGLVVTVPFVFDPDA